MAIQFDWYENPKTNEQGEETQTLHPRLRLNGKVTTDELRERIQRYCTLTETDVLAVLDALSHAMGRELSEGRQVHLDGIGYFRPQLTSTEEVTKETKRKSTKVKLKGIVFRPDRTLMGEVGTVKVKHTRFSFHSVKWTDQQVDALVEEYFDTHDFMQRRDFQVLCQMTQSTALRHLRRLCREGKLKNVGRVRQPIYCLGDGQEATNG